jgi:O-acetylhomoserine/O-acetylserine sulfhydrylase-like pyridoxal-dependent enzyme
MTSSKRGNTMRPETAAIHAGWVSPDQSGATTAPVYQTVAYPYPTAEELADIFGGRAPGYIYTRIANPASTIFHEFRPEELRQMRIDEDMIRVAVGIEDFKDIREDFQQAIEQSGGI